MRLDFWLSVLCEHLSSNTRPTARRHRRVRHKASSSIVESLESRRLLSAGAVAVGTETRINTVTTGVQLTPSVAMDAGGDYVIAWASSTGDGSGYGVYAQRYNAAGIAQGTAFKVNTFTTGDQSIPSVAMDAAGDFVIAWSSKNQDGSDYGIFAKRFNAAGVAQGNEFRVNSYTTGVQDWPSVAMDSHGDFAITWESHGQDGTVAGMPLYGIYAQRYNAAGVAQGGEFKVNSYTTKGNPIVPKIAMDGTGDFAVVWASYTSATSSHVYAQRFAAGGVKQGTEFNPSPLTTNVQFSPSIGMNASGNFVIAWSNDINASSSVTQIDAQRYGATGAAVGTPFKVNTVATTYVDNSAVAMDTAGDFVIAWSSYFQDGSYMGTYAQRYVASGAAAGTEFKVNTYTFASQYLPSIASDAAGDFIVAWESYSQDGSDYGIYAQRYAPPANHAPLGTAKTVTTLEDTPYTFKGTDFGFTDPNDSPHNSLLAVKISSLPTAGTLTDNGVAVVVGTQVTVSDLNAGRLKFVPVANKNGAFYSSFTFQVRDDGGTARGGVDTDPTARKLTISVTAVNDAPSGVAKTVATHKNTAYLFKITDFGFSDINDSPPNTFLAVKITTLPLVGRLTDNGIAVVAGSKVSVADITAGKLKYTPATNGTGAAYASFTFQVQDNGGTWNGGIDTDLTPRKMTISVT